LGLRKNKPLLNSRTLGYGEKSRPILIPRDSEQEREEQASITMQPFGEKSRPLLNPRTSTLRGRRAGLY
jgi:hypothetical protein